MVIRTFVAVIASLVILTALGCSYIPGKQKDLASSDVISDGAMLCEYDPYGTLICKG